ncbi:MAG: TonB-dependent siderophore receptor [Methylocystis sp.]
MFRSTLLRGVSAGVLILIVSSQAIAQQALPTIEVGRSSAKPLNGNRSGGEGRSTQAAGSSRSQTPKSDPTAYAVMDSSTALKTDTPILKTPFSVQVVPQQVLQDQQATEVEDAVKNVSGVQLPWTGGQYQDFIIRGFGTRNARFRNGIRLPANRFDLANVERIEVLKGPAAMLYGRTEPGGMVNVVTRQPQETASHYVQQQFGNYAYYRTSLDSTGKLNDDGSLLYRFDASYWNAGSFRDFINNERVFLAPSVTWKPTADDDLNLNFEYQHDLAPYDSGIPAIGDRVANVPINRNYSNPGFNRDRIDSRLIDFSWTHRFNEAWKARSGVVFNWIDYTFNENPVAYFQTNLENTLTPQVRRGIYFEDFYRRGYTAYSDLTGKFETGPLTHEVLLGANYYVQRVNNSGYFGLNARSLPLNSIYRFSFVDLYNPVYPALPFDYFSAARRLAPNDYGLNKDEWATVYFHDQIGFGDGVYLLGGGRYDWSTSTHGASTTELWLPVTTADTSIRRTDRFSPKAGVVFTPLPYISVYGSYAEGFGSNNFGRSATGRVLPPETSYQWEWGVKSELFDKRVLASLAFYQLTKQNVAVLTGDSVSFDTIGAARSRGVEFDFQGKVTDALSLIVSYAYTDARYIRTAVGDDHLGRHLPGAAPSAGSIWAKYDFQDPQFKGLSVGAGVFAASDRAGDKGYSRYYYSLPAYARVDLMAAYKFDYLGKKLSAQLNINNVNNVRYYAPCLPYNCSKAFNGVGEPLTVKGALRVEF